MTAEEIFQKMLALQDAGDTAAMNALRRDLRNADILERGEFDPWYWDQRARAFRDKEQRKNGWFILTSSDAGPRERFDYAEALALYAAELHRPVTLTQYTPDGKPWRYMRSRGPQESQWIRLPDGQM